jgi:hypothetical protein
MRQVRCAAWPSGSHAVSCARAADAGSAVRTWAAQIGTGRASVAREYAGRDLQVQAWHWALARQARDGCKASPTGTARNHPSTPPAARPLTTRKGTTMITHDQTWALPHGNTLVPSSWQATLQACSCRALVLTVSERHSKRPTMHRSRARSPSRERGSSPPAGRVEPPPHDPGAWTPTPAEAIAPPDVACQVKG